MTRFLVFIALALLASWLIRRTFLQLVGRASRHPLGALLRALMDAKSPGPGRGGPGGGPTGAPGGQLVRCSRCGTHVPPARARETASGSICDECDAG